MELSFTWEYHVFLYVGEQFLLFPTFGTTRKILNFEDGMGIYTQFVSIFENAMEKYFHFKIFQFYPPLMETTGDDIVPYFHTVLRE